VKGRIFKKSKSTFSQWAISRGIFNLFIFVPNNMECMRFGRGN